MRSTGRHYKIIFIYKQQINPVYEKRCFRMFLAVFCKVLLILTPCILENSYPLYINCLTPNPSPEAKNASGEGRKPGFGHFVLHQWGKTLIETGHPLSRSMLSRSRRGGRGVRQV
jgi:hypothetical protein